MKFLIKNFALGQGWEVLKWLRFEKQPKISTVQFSLYVHFFYLTTVASHFPVGSLKSQNFDIQKTTCFWDITHVYVRKENISSTFLI